MAEVTVTIDGNQVSGREGMTILEVAQENGIDIPTLCHHPLLTPTGACGVWVVEDESNNELVASCITTIVLGMVISTNSARVIEARRNIVELLLTCHPDSCLVCDKGNRCEMRSLASKLGIGQTQFDRIRSYHHFEDANPFIERNLTLCILCGRCVRACQEIRGAAAIDFAYRGFSLKPATAMDTSLLESTCQSCGLCVSSRLGVRQILEILTRITQGEGKEGDIQLLERAGILMKEASLCNMCQAASNPVLTSIRYFLEEYEAHITQKKCPVSVCQMSKV